MRKAVLLVAALAAVGSSLAQDRGLTATTDALGGARWQARFERDDFQLPLRSRPAMALGQAGSQTLRLLTDYQFDTLRLGQTGGLRLTGGLLINLRNTGGGPTEPSPTLPYAGIGFASGSSSNGNGWQWGVSADLGLTANGLGVSLANRNGSTGLSMDGNLRDLRLQPMIRLGMNVAF